MLKGYAASDTDTDHPALVRTLSGLPTGIRWARQEKSLDGSRFTVYDVVIVYIAVHDYSANNSGVAEISEQLPRDAH